MRRLSSLDWMLWLGGLFRVIKHLHEPLRHRSMDGGVASDLFACAPWPGGEDGR